jgi:hypothetical protein
MERKKRIIEKPPSEVKPEEKPVEIKPEAEVKEKEKPTEKKPLEAMLNRYGFVHFGKSLLEALGWPAKEDIDLNVEVSEGKVTFSKKADA